MASAEELQQLLEGPGLMPPPGVIPNFIDPPSQYGVNIFTQVICLITATICVVIRMYTRFKITRSHGWEDYTCGIAWLGLVAYVTLMLVPIFRNNAGVHQWDMQGKTLIQWAKIANGIEIAYVPIIFIAKLSILLLYLRIFVPAGKTKTYWAIQAVILFNLLFYIANLPIEIWPCIPRSKLWNPTESGHCINNEAVFVAGGSINVVSDFSILLLPMVSVWRLQMPLRRKIGVCAIFATGLFGCISSIMHLATSVTSAQNPDQTYYLFPVALWTLAEITAAIVCGCLICMPNFFRHVGPKVVSKLSFSRHTRGSSGKSSGLSKASFVPVRAEPPEWDKKYNPAPKGNDHYMELGESNTWGRPAVPAKAVHHEDGVGGKSEWKRSGGVPAPALLPNSVAMATATSPPSHMYPRPDSPHLFKKPDLRAGA